MKPKHRNLPHPGWPAIVLALKACGLSQQAVAQKTGMSQNFISNLLRGKRHDPRFDRGLKLYVLYLNRVKKLDVTTCPL